MEKAQFGMVGLGTMGRNFLLNVAEHGFSCVGYDLDAEKRKLLFEEGAGMPVEAAEILRNSSKNSKTAQYYAARSGWQNR
jgi:6-phosphogluconate dehydrogenase (decarboxylating)